MKKYFLFASAALLVSVASYSEKSSVNLNPDAAMKELKDGNTRFIANQSGHCATDTAVRPQLVTSQAPNAIVLSCSDSRVPPETVFDQGLGQLFTVRVAGNILTAETLGSIEYAISHLGSKLIVVMGHESCGAIKAALNTPTGGDAGSPSINILIHEIQNNLGTQSKISEKTLREPVQKNVSAVAESLVKRSKIVRDAVNSGKVKIAKAIYSLSTGKVDFWK